MHRKLIAIATIALVAGSATAIHVHMDSFFSDLDAIGEQMDLVIDVVPTDIEGYVFENEKGDEMLDTDKLPSCPA